MSLKTPNAFADREDILLHTALFKQVSPAEAKELLPHLEHVTLDKGDYIFSEGGTGQRMHSLERRRIKLIHTSSDDRVQLLSVHVPGEVLDGIPVLDPHGGPRTVPATFVSRGMRMVWLEHDALLIWLDEHPRVAIDMLQVIASRQHGNNERIFDLVSMDVLARLAKTLLSLGSCFDEPVEQDLEVPHDLTQEELAQLAGSSRKIMNEVLMDFSNHGWITHDGRPVIVSQLGMLIWRSWRWPSGWLSANVTLVQLLWWYVRGSWP